MRLLVNIRLENQLRFLRFLNRDLALFQLKRLYLVINCLLRLEALLLARAMSASFRSVGILLEPVCASGIRGVWIRLMERRETP